MPDDDTPDDPARRHEPSRPDGGVDADRPAAETPQASVGSGAAVDPDVDLGYRYAPDAGPAVVGDDATVRSGSVIYGDTTVGDGLTTGHRVLVREHTVLGDDVLVGTDTVVEDHCEIGSHVRLQTGVYVPTHTDIGNNVFIGPNAVLTNDPYPVRQEREMVGPTIEDGASIAANATVLPGVTVGEDADIRLERLETGGDGGGRQSAPSRRSAALSAAIASARLSWSARRVSASFSRARPS